MPIHPVIKKGKIYGYEWGHQKVYPTWKYGNKAKDMARKQGVAINISRGTWKNNVIQNWHGNIEKQTIQNENYRKVVETGNHAQLVFMSLKPKQEIGNEVHPKVDQFFRIEKGTAKFVLNNGKDKYTEKNGGAVFVPAKTWHNVINPSSKKELKLYTIYSPKNHPAGLIQKDRPARDRIGRNAVEPEVIGVAASEYLQVQNMMKTPTRQIVPVDNVIVEVKQRKYQWIPRQMRGKI